MAEDQTISDTTGVTLASAGLADAVSAGASALEEEVVGWFDELQAKLMRYLLTAGLSVPDAEEIVQETFLALFKHLTRGKPRHNIPAWIFRVAHNLALRRRSLVQRDRQNLLESPSYEFVAGGDPNPEDQLALKQRLARLAGVWQALPEQARLCLALRAEGLTYREIAQVLGMSLGAVSISLARSLARFACAQER